MTIHHLHCKIKRTPEEAARLRADRERYQRERPTPQQLLAEGGHTEFNKLGELLLLHQAVAWLKQERERQNLTLAEISKRTGIDQAALSRLETGKNSNPTLDTLYRVAAALGKIICWIYQDSERIPQSLKGDHEMTMKVTTNGHSILDTADHVLTLSKRSMTPEEMVQVMQNLGWWTPPRGGKTPEQTLVAAIYREIKDQGSKARFAKVAKGKFRRR